MESVLVLVEEILRNHRQNILLLLNLARLVSGREDRDAEMERRVRYNLMDRTPEQVRHRDMLFGLTNKDCVTNLRMDRNKFGWLCHILRGRCGFIDQKFVTLEEQVAMFLSLLAHHKENRVMGFDFLRSGQTMSR